PLHRMGNDEVEVVKARLPAEFSLGAGGISDNGYGVAGAAGAHAHVEIAPDHALDGLEHFENRIAGAIAAIGRKAAAARAQPVERQSVGVGQIADMDVIT